MMPNALSNNVPPRSPIALFSCEDPIALGTGVALASISVPWDPVDCYADGPRMHMDKHHPFWTVTLG